MIRQNTENYQQLFLQDTPIMDIRAPIEFDKKAFPNRKNIPLLL